MTLPILISLASLAVSLLTLWLTNFRWGRLRMTMPTIVFLGFDQVPKTTAKIFVRTLLYSTAARGQVVESMFATVHHDGKTQDFTFWGYGPAKDLSPGSGLYVDKSGMAANHHFVLSVHDPAYQFTEGAYEIQIFARTARSEKPTQLCSISLDLTAEHADALGREEGILFERRPSGIYEGHADPRPR